ncbi:uncharacterized protein LOC129594885 isoform X2 [Paramacrobiotus metropolitanus]|nr:uncharacterized protein LOC129594885 isoform X2 [Paramacrobiotus metropolitanus]
MGLEDRNVNAIIQYRNGKPVGEKLAAVTDEKACPTAKPAIPSTQCSVPKKLGALRLPCPTSSTPDRCLPDGVHEWECSKCHQLLMYGFDDHLYCKCGKAAAEWYRFHCGQQRHGSQYSGFRPNVLTSFLQNLKPFKEINIIILGENTAESSTWINGFVNCVICPELSKALTDPIHLVSTADSSDSNNPKKSEAEVSDSANTTYTKTYAFRNSNNLIRLIDTTTDHSRGNNDHQEVQNFPYIIKDLTKYDGVHGICILVPPNNGQSTRIAKFLQRLHRDVCRNIVFILTGGCSIFSRGTVCKALERFMENCKYPVHLNVYDTGNVYCMDYEAFNSAATLQSRSKVTGFCDANLDKIWETAAQDANRLVKYLGERAPYKLQPTISLLNECRETIKALTEVVQQISETNKKPKSVLDERAQELQQLIRDRSDLEKHLYVPSITLETISLPYPRLVCVGRKCVKVIGNKVNYVTHCHEPCYCVIGPVPGVYPTPGVQNCVAMDSTKLRCSKCGCSWEFHMQVEYETKEVEVSMVDEKIQTLLGQKSSEIVAAKLFAKDCEEGITRINKEMEEIFEVAALLMYYIKNNAIVSGTDSMGEFLRFLIANEEKKVAAGSTRKCLDDYQAVLQTYVDEQKLLELTMADESTNYQVITSKVSAAIKSLYGLDISGEIIKSLVEKCRKESAPMLPVEDTSVTFLWKLVSRHPVRKCGLPTKTSRTERKQESLGMMRPTTTAIIFSMIKTTEIVNIKVMATRFIAAPLLSETFQL